MGIARQKVGSWALAQYEWEQLLADCEDEMSSEEADFIFDLWTR